MINFTQAFDLAWERMLVILFRPFDFGKWCAIGLSAFLAGFLEGGNGFNTSYNTKNLHGTGFLGSTPVPGTKFDFGQINSNLGHLFAGMEVGLIVLLAVFVIGFIFALLVLIYWLGARGQFLFLDNVVRNRGAISWPWNNYKRQANSLLGFYLLVMLISFLLVVPFIIIVVLGLMAAAVGGSPWTISFSHWAPTGPEIVGMVVLFLIYAIFVLAISCVMFVFREFGVPLMFRHGMLARPAFWATLKLVQRNPGSVAVFVLLRIAIFIAVAILSLIACCGTCCAELIPYVGTVILLPVIVYVRCFTLDCLAQFGPEYDVWTVDVPPPQPLEGQPPA
jgi:hypothetical protein